MSNNFKVFDENAINMVSDSSYASSTQRQNGVTGGLATSNIHNKLFYQVSSMAYCLAQFASNLGQIISDVSLSALTTALTNILTPTSHRGLELTYTNSHQISVAAGGIMSSDGTTWIVQPTAATLDISTSGLGGIQSSGFGLGANTGIQIFIGMNTSTGATAFVMGNSAAQLVSAGYTKTAQIGALWTLDGSTITQFLCRDFGNMREMLFTSPVSVVSGFLLLSSGFTSIPCPVPSGAYGPGTGLFGCQSAVTPASGFTQVNLSFIPFGAGTGRIILTSIVATSYVSYDTQQGWIDVGNNSGVPCIQGARDSDTGDAHCAVICNGYRFRI